MIDVAAAWCAKFGRDLPTGSEWHDAVIRAGKLGNGGPTHGDPRRWDWGATVKTLAIAIQNEERIERMAAEMPPEQLAALWHDDSAQARKLRTYAMRLSR